MAHIHNISCLEIADKNPDLNLPINLVASFAPDSHRACAAIFDDAGFWAVLRLELAVRFI
jgi:hypothetical protein